MILIVLMCYVNMIESLDANIKHMGNNVAVIDWKNTQNSSNRQPDYLITSIDTWQWVSYIARIIELRLSDGLNIKRMKSSTLRNVHLSLAKQHQCLIKTRYSAHLLT